MTADIHGHGQSGHMGGHGLDTKPQRRGPAAEALGADAQTVDLLQQLRFQSGVVGIRIRLVDGAKQRVLCQGGHLVKGTADPHADHNGRAGVGAGRGDGVDDKFLDALHTVRRFQHGEPAHVFTAEALGDNGKPQRVARDKLHGDGCWGVVLGVDPTQRIAHHALSQIALRIAPTNTLLDRLLEIAFDVDLLSQLRKDTGEARVLADGQRLLPGGVELLEKTIQEDFGIRVDGYVSIDFGGFIEAVASLGNMQMELTEEEADYMNAHPEYGWADIGETWDLQPGWNTLTPNQFLCYARMRHLGNSDFDRTERQRKVLMTCYQQVKNCSVPQLLSLIDSVAPYITTDIRGTDLLSYAYMLAGDGVNNIESNRLPAEGTYQMKNINGMEVLVPDLEQNKAILQEYINNTRSNQDEAEAGDGDDHMGVVQGHMAVAESNPVENE